MQLATPDRPKGRHSRARPALHFPVFQTLLALGAAGSFVGGVVALGMWLHQPPELNHVDRTPVYVDIEAAYAANKLAMSILKAQDALRQTGQDLTSTTSRAVVSQMGREAATGATAGTRPPT